MVLKSAVSGGGGGGPVTSASITDSTATGRGVLTAASAAAARVAVGAYASAPTSATEVGTFYVALSGSDTNDGRTEQTPVQTLNQALVLTAANGNIGDIRLRRGVIPVLQTAIIPQAVTLSAFGPLASQQTELVWMGADDGSYVIRTASNTSGADWTQGRLSGFLLRPNASKPGGGAYTNLNGLHLRNAQNSARVSDIQVKNFPGLGVMADWENAGVPSDGFPGYVTLERVWSSGNNVNWHVYGGFTSLLFNMCAGDVSSNTTDVFILDGRTGGTLGGRGGNFIFLGFKSEDNGTPTGVGADPNYFTINTDFGVQFDGCSGKRSTPGTKPWINYTATPTSQNAVAGGIPLTIRNSHTSNMPVMVKGPDGANWLAPAIGNGGQSFQVAEWNGQNQAPKKWTGTHSGFVADGVSVNATDNTANALHVGSAPVPSVAPVQFDGPVFTDTFTAADSTSVIPAPDAGPTGSALVGTWGISGNKAYLSSTTHNAVYIFPGVGVDGTLHCDVTKSSGLGSPGMAFRVIDATHGLFWYYKRFTGELALLKHAGSTPVILKVANVTWAAGATKHVAVSMVGPVITIYLDGVQTLTWTLIGGDEVTYGSATGVGLRQNGNSTADSTNYDDGGSRYDNLSFVAPVVRVSTTGQLQVFTAGAWATVTHA